MNLRSSRSIEALEARVADTYVEVAAESQLRPPCACFPGHAACSQYDAALHGMRGLATGFPKPGHVVTATLRRRVQDRLSSH